MVESLDDPHLDQIDERLRDWQQGDCVLGEHWFLYRTSRLCPLTEAGAVAVSEDMDNAEAEVLGLGVVTQTCDLVRRCEDRPFVEVCPLVEVEDSTLHEIQRGRRPNYAFIPGVAERSLVADLDRVMTVEKSVVETWDRVP